MRDMPRNISRAAIIGVVLAGLAAAGCSGGQSDLQKWIADTKKKPGGRIQALPEVSALSAFLQNGVEGPRDSVERRGAARP